MTSIFLPAAPGHAAIYLRTSERGTGFMRRTIVGWQVVEAMGRHTFPVTLNDGEGMPEPHAVVFPDGHVEEVDGRRAWRDLITYRAALDREARARSGAEAKEAAS